MRIHCYAHDVPLASRDVFDSHTIGAIMAYLQGGGREDIAWWSHAVENTVWQGGEGLLWPGMRLTYQLSRN